MGLLISALLFQPPENPKQILHGKQIWLTTSIGNKIPVCYITQPQARFTILYSHGNAEDLGMVNKFLTELSKVLYVNVLAYDYCGYGVGALNKHNIERNVEPSEENCYADIEAAFDYLTKKKKVDPKSIILYGRSVGSGPSCYLAQKLSKEYGTDGIGGLVLHSPFLSVCRVVIDCGVENPYDIFPNVTRIKDVCCPVFILHGTRDSVVPFKHGVQLYENVPKNVRIAPFWAPNMGHNNIESEMTSLYIKKLQKFLLHLLQIQNPDVIEKALKFKKKTKVSILPVSFSNGGGSFETTNTNISTEESKPLINSSAESPKMPVEKSKLARTASPKSILNFESREDEDEHESLPQSYDFGTRVESRICTLEHEEIECIVNKE